MALLSTQTIAATGLTPTYASASGGGDTVRVVKNLFLHVKNGGGSSITVTIATPGDVDGLAIADRTVTVANGAESMIPITDTYRASNGLASISYSGVTTVTVAAIRVG